MLGMQTIDRTRNVTVAASIHEYAASPQYQHAWKHDMGNQNVVRLPMARSSESPLRKS